MSVRFSLAMFFLAAAASSATAQLSPGMSGISDAPTTATEDQYWFFVRELGRCLARTKRNQSVALLESRIDSAEEKRAFSSLINRRGNNVCMGNMVSAVIIRAQVRGSVAEGLYKAQVAAVTPRPVLQDPSSPVAIRSIHDFAACYVSANPQAAHNLLSDTKLGTREENERVRQMAPSFESCLPTGRQVRLVPMDVRLALAEALYRANTGRSTTVGGLN